MKSVTIKINTTQNVKDLVNTVSMYPYDIDVRSGRYVIDAKSLLGIYSLDLTKPVTLEIYSDDCGELLKELDELIVK
ncbi:MAG: HPr family phosphocarrier protein [Eubacteriales bacterium]|nr:HPr family phosphocarrier protein [Eubacteriales bacterium]